MLSVRKFNEETKACEALARLSGRDISHFAKAARRAYREGQKWYGMQLLQMMAIGAYQGLSNPIRKGDK